MNHEIFILRNFCSLRYIAMCVLSNTSTQINFKYHKMVTCILASDYFVEMKTVCTHFCNCHGNCIFLWFLCGDLKNFQIILAFRFYNDLNA